MNIGGPTFATLLIIIAGFQEPAAASCGEASDVHYINVTPVAMPQAPRGVVIRGLIPFYMSIHHRLGSVIVPGKNVPEAIKHADKVDASSVTSLLYGNIALAIMMATSVLLAAALLAIGLRYIYMQWQQRSTDFKVQAETVTEAAARRKWCLGFWVVLVAFFLMALGAILTRGHATRVLDGVQEEAKFLTVNVPELLYDAVQDMEVISGQNFAEFLSGQERRLNDCAEEAVEAVDQAAAKSNLMEIVTTTADRVKEMLELVKKIERAANSPFLKELRTNVYTGSTYIKEAQKTCTGICSKQWGNRVVPAMKELDQFHQRSEIKLPSDVKDLEKKLKNDDLAAMLQQISPVKNVRKEFKNRTKEIKQELHHLGDLFAERVDLFNASVERSLKSFQKAMLTLGENIRDMKKDFAIYNIIVTLVAGITTLIVALYMLGNQCLPWRISMGCCSLSVASWILKVSSLVFLIVFPILMPASTLGTAVTMAADHKLCVPALDLEAPSSSSFIEFLASRLASKEAHHGTSALHQDDKQFTSASRIAGRQRQRGVGSSKPRRMLASPRTQSRRRKSVTASVPKPVHAKRLAALPRLKHKTAARFQSEEQGEDKYAAEARSRWREMPEGNDIGSLKTPTDLLSPIRKHFSQKRVQRIIERFALCRHTRQSFLDLLGKEFMENQSTALLGKRSPWLGLLNDTVGLPRVKALNKLARERWRLLIDPAIRRILISVNELPVQVPSFEDLATTARDVRRRFSAVELTTLRIHPFMTGRGETVENLKKANASLHKVLGQEHGFKALMDDIEKNAQDLGQTATIGEGNLTMTEYMQDILANLYTIESEVLESARNNLKKVGHKTKDGTERDLALYFHNAKMQFLFDRTCIQDRRKYVSQPVDWIAHLAYSDHDTVFDITQFIAALAGQPAQVDRCQLIEVN